MKVEDEVVENDLCVGTTVFNDKAADGEADQSASRCGSTKYLLARTHVLDHSPTRDRGHRSRLCFEDRAIERTEDIRRASPRGRVLLR